MSIYTHATSACSKSRGQDISLFINSLHQRTKEGTLYSNEIFVCSPGPGSVAPHSADLVEMNKRRLFGPSLSLRRGSLWFWYFYGHVLAWGSELWKLCPKNGATRGKKKEIRRGKRAMKSLSIFSEESEDEGQTNYMRSRGREGGGGGGRSKRSHEVCLWLFMSAFSVEWTMRFCLLNFNVIDYCLRELWALCRIPY